MAYTYESIKKHINKHAITLMITAILGSGAAFAADPAATPAVMGPPVAESALDAAAEDAVAEDGSVGGMEGAAPPMQKEEMSGPDSAEEQPEAPQDEELPAEDQGPAETEAQAGEDQDTGEAAPEEPAGAKPEKTEKRWWGRPY